MRQVIPGRGSIAVHPLAAAPAPATMSRDELARELAATHARIATREATNAREEARRDRQRARGADVPAVVDPALVPLRLRASVLERELARLADTPTGEVAA